MKEEFNQPKPMMFPFIFDSRPKKLINLSKDNANFDDVLLKKIDQKNPQSTPASSTPTSVEKTINKNVSLGHTVLQTAQLQKGLSYLPAHMIAAIDQTGERTNFENKLNKNIINLNVALQSGISSQLLSDIKKKKKYLYNTDADTYGDDTEENPVSGATYTHNLNPYQGMTDTNIFKKQDQHNYNLFKDSPMHQLLNNSSMSPLRHLGNDVWDSIEQTVQSIQDKTITLDDIPDPFTDNDINSFEIKSNYDTLQNATDTWKFWSDQESFGFITKRWADIKNYLKVIRQFGGKTADQFKHMKNIQTKESQLNQKEQQAKELLAQYNQSVKNMMDKINSTDNLMQSYEAQEAIEQEYRTIDELNDNMDKFINHLSDEDQRELEFQRNQLYQIKSETEKQQIELDNMVNTKSIHSANQWWETIGQKLDQVGLLVPFGLFAEGAETILKKMNLSLPSEPHLENNFQDQMILKYGSYLKDTLLDPLITDETVTFQDLKIDNATYGLELENYLKEKGYLSSTGMLTDHFDIHDLNHDFGMHSTSENRRIQRVLKSKAQGEFSFDQLDNQQNNQLDREFLKINDPNGNSWDLKDLIQHCFPTDNSIETYKKTRETYTILFDMLETMTSLSLKKKGKLEPQIKQTEQGYQLNVYPHAQWQEYDGELNTLDSTTGETTSEHIWTTIENEPLTLSFSTKEKAESFYQTIQSLVLHLEPLVGSFEPSNNEQINLYEKSYENDQITDVPIRVLTDNEGYLEPNGIITHESEKFHYSADILPNQAFFDTKHWNRISSFLKNKIMHKIGMQLFEGSLINRVNQSHHKKKIKKYKEEKKEFDEKKYEEKIDEKKREAKRKAKQKQTMNQIEAQNKKKQKELQAYQKKVQKEQEMKRKAMQQAALKESNKPKQKSKPQPKRKK